MSSIVLTCSLAVTVKMLLPLLHSYFRTTKVFINKLVVFPVLNVRCCFCLDVRLDFLDIFFCFVSCLTCSVTIARLPLATSGDSLRGIGCRAAFGFFWYVVTNQNSLDLHGWWILLNNIYKASKVFDVFFCSNSFLNPLQKCVVML